MEKQWILEKEEPGLEKYLSLELGITPLVARLLINRGIRDKEAGRRFLHVSHDNLHDPFLIPDMEKAVERLCQAIKNKEGILVWGDYDVDGVTGTALYLNFFKGIHDNVTFYIPHRLREGYGLNENALYLARQRKSSIVLTVDCGTSSIDAVTLLQASGIDVIITDHHEPPPLLPPAFALLNPCRHDSMYPFRNLTGVGVAYKLICALSQYMGSPLLEDHSLSFYLDLVALGTVADVAPLMDENRFFVKEGLALLTRSERTGIKALKEVSGFQSKDVTADAVGFIFGPRINAAGRIGSASDAVQLLTTENLDVAMDIAGKLERANQERQRLENSIRREITKELLESPEDGIIIVKASPEWHQGVIGIVASRIVEEFYRPCILISLQDGIGKGSARSIPGLNIYEVLHECRDILLKYGGHKYAAGLTIKEGYIPVLKERLARSVTRELPPKDLIPRIYLDGEIELEDITFQAMKEMSLLPPYGNANPEPAVLTRAIRIQNPRIVGRDHLKLKLRKGRVFFPGIGFSMASSYNGIIEEGRLLDVVYTPELNYWNGTYGIHLKLKDMKVSRNA